MPYKGGCKAGTLVLLTEITRWSPPLCRTCAGTEKTTSSSIVDRSSSCEGLRGVCAGKQVCQPIVSSTWSPPSRTLRAALASQPSTRASGGAAVARRNVVGGRRGDPLHRGRPHVPLPSLEGCQREGLGFSGGPSTPLSLCTVACVSASANSRVRMTGARAVPT